MKKIASRACEAQPATSPIRWGRRPPYARQVEACIDAGLPIPEVWIFHGPAAFDRAASRLGGLVLHEATDPQEFDWAVTAGREVLIVPASQQQFSPDTEWVRWVDSAGKLVEKQRPCSEIEFTPCALLPSRAQQLALACLHAGATVVRWIDGSSVRVFGYEEGSRHDAAR